MPVIIAESVRVRWGLAALACLAAAWTGRAVGDEAPRTATPASSIMVPADFHVELLRSAQAGEDSWISMTFDAQGRIIVGLDTVGLARLAPAAEASTDWTFERLDDTLKHCRGVLYAHDSLYVNATDSQALYRLQDRDGDGVFESRDLLTSYDYRSRYGHGPNQLTLGPDGMLYLAIGNDVSFPEDVSPESPYRNPHRDRLLPDPRDDGQDERVGYILRTDADGTQWTVIAGGFRNQVDVAFNTHGEMFTWDADMEWDIGLPWYRPTRLNHVVSGGEYGWRWGKSKWPNDSPDALPSNLDTGLGSPTALVFGVGSRFPAAYRDRLFMADWQHGKILAVTLTPQGSTYAAHDELFAAGGPLNVCDMAFGPDGALYFITGGRGSQSGLYRVSYTGPVDVAGSIGGETDSDSEDTILARRLRKELEAHHARPMPGAVDEIWPHLGHRDRWIRHAARVALERQDPATWRDRIAIETDRLRQATAALALARVTPPGEGASIADSVIETLLVSTTVDDETVVAASLRACSIMIARGTALSPEQASAVTSALDEVVAPNGSALGRELCEMLIALDAPGVVAQSLDRLETVPSQEEQIHVAHALLRSDATWNLEDRTRFLDWLAVAKTYRGGNLFPVAITNLQDDFLASLTEAEQSSLAAKIERLRVPPAEQETVVSRPFVRRWTLADLEPHFAEADTARDAASGRSALAAASCLKCHRFQSSGTAIGPDLTHVGRRFDVRAIAESILDPSKVIDPKYHSTVWVLSSGRVVTGRAGQVTGKQIVVEVNAATGESVTIARDEIEASHPSDVSPMPSGLLDTLTREEILDLLALLHTAGETVETAGGD